MPSEYRDLMRACECSPDIMAIRASECPPDIAAMRALSALREGATVRASCETRAFQQPATQGYNPAFVPNPTSDQNGLIACAFAWTDHLP